MTPRTSVALVGLAMTFVGDECHGRCYRCYEWETGEEFRVLMCVDGGEEVDIDMFKLTGTFRVWKNGTEWGNPECN